MIASCGSVKKIAYFQGIDDAAVERNVGSYEMRIRPDDNLYISIGTLNPDAAAMFNPADTSSAITSPEAVQLKGYLVDREGYIEYPVLGRVKLGGMTKAEAAEYLRGAVADYIKNPTVNIRFLNFKVTLLGEVAKPGTYDVKSDRITLLEALGMAGDMTIYGKRKNILVCRDNNGQKQYARVDMTSPEVFESEFYYLQQNDVIYVQPNSARASSASYDQSSIYIGMSLTSLAITIVAFIMPLL